MRPLILIAALLLTGCTTPQQRLEFAMQRLEIDRQAARPVTCTAGEDCEVKWGRALQWVLDNSAYKLQTQSDALLSTFGPFPNDPRPAYSISKVATGGGNYVIDFRGGCDNIFGCQPTLLEGKASFVGAVMGP